MHCRSSIVTWGTFDSTLTTSDVKSTASLRSMRLLCARPTWKKKLRCNRKTKPSLQLTTTAHGSTHPPDRVNAAHNLANTKLCAEAAVREAAL
jgi:hypothetical protein